MGSDVTSIMLSFKPWMALGVFFLSTAFAQLFGYDGVIGPEHWASLSPNWATCGNGAHQSPININTEEITVNPSGLEALSIRRIEEDEFEFENLGTTLEVVVEHNGGTLEGGFLSGGFELRQFHYHSPSEHTIDGVHFPLELHLVHKNPTTGAIAVLDVLFDVGEHDNDFLNTHINDISEIPLKGDHVEVEVEPYELFDEFHNPLIYYNYVGSLTTPPCTEGVNWYVLHERASLSQHQLDAIRNKLVGGNNRPLQSNANPVHEFVPEEQSSYFDFTEDK
jgi:carbonic anhydrase